MVTKTNFGYQHSSNDLILYSAEKRKSYMRLSKHWQNDHFGWTIPLSKVHNYYRGSSNKPIDVAHAGCERRWAEQAPSAAHPHAPV